MLWACNKNSHCNVSQQGAPGHIMQYPHLPLHLSNPYISWFTSLRAYAFIFCGISFGQSRLSRGPLELLDVFSGGHLTTAKNCNNLFSLKTCESRFVRLCYSPKISSYAGWTLFDQARWADHIERCPRHDWSTAVPSPPLLTPLTESVTWALLMLLNNASIRWVGGLCRPHPTYILLQILAVYIMKEHNNGAVVG